MSYGKIFTSKICRVHRSGEFDTTENNRVNLHRFNRHFIMKAEVDSAQCTSISLEVFRFLLR